MRTDWTREELTALPHWKRPTVRAEYGGRVWAGEIGPDGNSVWVTARTPDGIKQMRVSWGLLLEVLNDGRTSPITIYPERPAVVPQLELFK